MHIISFMKRKLNAWRCKPRQKSLVVISELDNSEWICPEDKPRMVLLFDELKAKAISLGFAGVAIYNIGDIGLFELRVLHENIMHRYMFQSGFAINHGDGIMEYHNKPGFVAAILWSLLIKLDEFLKNHEKKRIG